MQFPEPYRRGESKIYYFMYTDPETRKRKCKSTGKKTKREAKEYITEFMKNLIEGITDKSFLEYAAPFFIWDDCPHVRRKLNENKTVGIKHIKHTRSWLERHVFSDKIFSHLKLSKIRRSDILTLRERIRKTTSINVVNKTMNAVKVIFTEAYYLEDIDRNPGSGIGALKYDKIQKGILEIDEIRHLFQERPGVWADGYCFDAFLVAAQTGMQRGEILALGKDYINQDDCVIEIHRAWKTRDVIGPPKWNKRRVIPATSAVMDALCRNLPGKDDLVFCYSDGSRLGQTWWRQRFADAMDRAGIKHKERNITPHSLRHSLNTHLVSGGCDIILIQAYLGWSSQYQYLTKVQKGYTHLKAIHMRDIADTIDRLYNSASPMKLLKKESV